MTSAAPPSHATTHPDAAHATGDLRARLPAARRAWSAGDWVVYHKSKQSRVPGRRAALIKPTGKGETYSYVVDKFWVVESVGDDGKLRLRTPGGKLHAVAPDDPNLSPAGLMTRLLWRHRFQRIQLPRGEGSSSADPS